MAKWISFQELRNRVSLEHILRHYGLMEKFRRSKDELIGLCPFHEETTGSFHASLTKNVFHCFGCQSKGNILDFVALTERVEVRQAAFMIQEWFQGLPEAKSESAVHAQEIQIGVSGSRDRDGGENRALTFSLTNLNPTHPYLAERGLDKETIEYFGRPSGGSPGYLPE